MSVKWMEKSSGEIDTPRVEDLEWYKRLKECAKIAELNEESSERFRYAFKPGKLCWINIDLEWGQATSADLDLATGAWDVDFLTLDEAFDMLKEFHAHMNRKLKRGAWDCMITPPTDWIFVHDWEFERAREEAK